MEKVAVNSFKPIKTLSALKTIRAVSYVRVSSDEQTKKEFSIPQLQMPECINFIKDSGWIFVKNYVDESKDCNTFFKRPALQQMLNDDIDTYDVVVVWSFDRLAGDDENTRGRIYSTLDRNKKQVTSVKQKVEIVPIDEYDPKSLNVSQFRQMNNMGVSWDRKIRRERFMDCRQKTVEGGKHITLPCYGYKIIRKVNPADERRTIGYRVIDEHEAVILKRIYKERLSGNSMRSIAVNLNREGIKTRKGATWDKTRLYRTLQNPFPCGYILWNRTQDRKYGDDRISTPLSKEKWKYIPVDRKKEKYYKPIIDKDTYDKIQEILNINKKLKSKAVSSTNILSGLLRCPECNKTLVETNFYKIKKPPYYHSYYRCAIYCNKGTCVGTGYSAWVLKDKILEEVERYIRRPELYNKSQRQEKKKRMLEKSKELKTQERKYKNVQSRIYSLNMKYIDGKIKEDYYRNILSGFEEEERGINNSIIELREEVTGYMEVKEETDKLKNFDKLLSKKFREIEPKTQKHILKLIIDNITLNKRTQKWQIFFKY